jgi:gluconokinase
VSGATVSLDQSGGVAGERVVIGLDVGTTGVKAAAFGIDRPWRAVALREYPLFAPLPGQHVEDPAAILRASTDVLAECVRAAAGATVVGVSVGAAMHGLLALDSGLRPLTPLITWADARATREAQRVHRDGRAATLHTITGTPVHPMSPLVKLLWFSSHDRAIWTAARWWVGLKDWILLGLTGRLVTELSSAGGTGLLDMATRTWSPMALELSGLDAGRLPPILPTTATLDLSPDVARLTGLPPATPVVVGAADGPLGNLGVAAVSPGVAGLSVGTSGAVRMLVTRPQIDAGRTLYCYPLIDDLWLLGGAISNGGSLLRWAGTALAPDVEAAAAAAEESADDDILRLAASVPAGSDGLVMLPYLLAERAPLWDPDLPGAYLGLRDHHRREHLVRAGLEGVCLQMRVIVDRLDQVQAVHEVRATGGVFRSPLWRTTMAAMLDRPIEVVGDAEGTALGAAALGLFALGLAPSPSAAVANLLGGGEVAVDTVRPDPALVATYVELRHSIPMLVEGLGKVAGLFTPGSGEG